MNPVDDINGVPQPVEALVNVLDGTRHVLVGDVPFTIDAARDLAGQILTAAAALITHATGAAPVPLAEAAAATTP